MKTKKPYYRNATTGKFTSKKIFNKQQEKPTIPESEGIIFDEKDELSWYRRMWQWVKDLVRLN